MEVQTVMLFQKKQEKRIASNALKGKKLSFEHRQKISETLKGTKVPFEVLKNRSEARKGVPQPNNGKARIGKK